MPVFAVLFWLIDWTNSFLISFSSRHSCSFIYYFLRHRTNAWNCPPTHTPSVMPRNKKNAFTAPPITSVNTGVGWPTMRDKNTAGAVASNSLPGPPVATSYHEITASTKYVCSVCLFSFVRSINHFFGSVTHRYARKVSPPNWNITII